MPVGTSPPVSIIEKSSLWEGGWAIYLRTANYGYASLNDLIRFVDNGFEVDDRGADGHPNKNGQKYSFVALIGR
jgi:hypothetical protein